MKRFYRMKVYPKSFYGGDRVGVYLFADDLETEEMKKFAEDSDYYKTAFVSASFVADIKIDIFNNLNSNQYCGNTIVSALSLLRDLNYIAKGLIFYELNQNIYPAIIQEDMVYIEFKEPIYYDYVLKEELSQCFNSISFHSKLKPQIVLTYEKELLLPVDTIDTLNQLMPIDEEIINLSNKYNIKGIHAFAISNDFKKEVYGRNFTPIKGIHEESITTTSNGALGCYLYKHYKKKKAYVLRQGYSIEQPSEIHVKINSSKFRIDSVWIGGTAYLINESPQKNLLVT